MTRRDYRIIATAINYVVRNGRSDLGPTVIKHIVLELCMRLTEDNPRFDSEKFKEACYGK